MEKLDLHIRLRFEDGWWMLTCKDLPGLILGHPGLLEDLLADFVPSWKKLHELAPHQVMAMPTQKEV